MKRIVTIALALVLIFGLATTASAAEEVTVSRPTGFAGNGSIQITLPDGFEGSATYEIYKVFDATVSENGQNVSYTLVDGKTAAPACFTLTNGSVSYSGESETDELTDADIAQIVAYVQGDSPVVTIEIPAGISSYTLANIPYGYYYITTSLGSVVAVDTTTPNATVQDKNTPPQLIKTVSYGDYSNKEYAVAPSGSTVEFEISITLGKGAMNYVLEDYMDAGLQLIGGSVRVYDLTQPEERQEIPATEGTYDVIITQNPGENDPDFKILFSNRLLEEHEEETLTVKYLATVIDATLVNGASNLAKLKYGEDDDTTDDATVFNAQIAVKKQDGAGAPLAGAGFVLKNEEGKYYVRQGVGVGFVSEIEEADEHFSNNKGEVEPFAGLGPGTYTLVENTVPQGYNKAADETITISAEYAKITSLVMAMTQEVTVTNNAGSVLPSTGGVGTTMFYVFGGVMVLFAAVLLITKKRMSAQ